MVKKDSKVSEIILKAAYEAIAENGYANSSLRDIAKEAGVALSQLHYYFGSKQALFRQVIIQMKDQYVGAFRGEIESLETSDQKIDVLVTFFQKILSEEPGLIRVFFDLYSLSLWSDDFRDLLSDLLGELSSLVELELLNDTDIDNVQVLSSKRDLSKLLIATVFGVAMQYTLNPEDNSHLIENLKLISMMT